MRVLITGANRGIGLSLVRKFLKEQHSVLACCRSPGKADELNLLVPQHPNTLSIRKLDVCNDEDIAALHKELVDKNLVIDVLLHNAGVLTARESAIEHVDVDTMMNVFRVNTVAPLVVTKALMEQVKSSDRKTIVVVSSDYGSVELNTGGGLYSYKVSKAGLNQGFKSVSVDHAKDGIRVLMLHPGWVSTDMGGSEAPVTPDDSAEGMYNVINDAAKFDGLFYDHAGKPMPW